MENQPYFLQSERVHYDKTSCLVFFVLSWICYTEDKKCTLNEMIHEENTVFSFVRVKSNDQTVPEVPPPKKGQSIHNKKS